MTISIAALGGSKYRVTVVEGSSRTVHEVTVTESDIRRYAPDCTAERLLEASFEFLLERESAQSILSRFELPVIERYFPEYPAQIRTRLR